MRILEYTITEDDGPLEVLEILKKKLLVSKREISSAKQYEDGITYDDTKITVRQIMQPGQTLRVRLRENTQDAEIIPVQGPLDIVYEDEDIICVNKPAGTTTHPSHGHVEDSICNWIAYHFAQKGEDHVMRAVGRLDRETSGLVVFAKNRHSAGVLSGKLHETNENISRRKVYYALVQGVPEEDMFTIDAPIGDVPGVKMLRHVTEDGKRAITHAKVVARYGGYSLMSFVLDTGRTHQIRVHMAYRGFPLLGDSLYGVNGQDNHGMSRCALHAGKISLVHPVTGKRLEFDAPLPEDMMRLTQK